VDHTDALAAVPLFAHLDRQTIKSLAEQGKSRSYHPGEVIVSEGNRATALYIIVSGKVEVGRSQVEGPVGDLGPGDFFGELALIEDHPRTATVRAVTETTCLLYPVWEFRALLGEHPEIALPIMNALIARLHRIEHHPAE
jgi:CRP/FNR family cyclic AMP-dependent transcriptional regulator